MSTPQETSSDPAILGFHDVASFCKTYRVGKTHLYDCLARGELSARKVGRSLRILKSDAAVWAASRPVAKFNR